MMKSFFCLLFFLCSFLVAEATDAFPVLYKGRFRAADAYAKLWTYEMSHSTYVSIPEKTSALGFLFILETKGSQPFKEFPLFWITDAATKQKMHLPLIEKRFSANQIYKRLVEDPQLKEDATLIPLFIILDQFIHLSNPKSINFDKAFKEKDLSLKKRLRLQKGLFKALPGKFKKGEWFPLHTLLMEIYDPLLNQFKPISNFTLYETSIFNEIQSAYKKWIQTGDVSEKEKLTNRLLEAYHSIAGHTYLSAYQKQLSYPSIWQLKTESLYVSYPWIRFLIGIYASAALCLLFSKKKALWILSFGLCFHTLLLIARSYILERPPVSNMFETILYVPWISVCLSLFIPSFRKNTYALLGAALISIFLLLAIEISDLNDSLDQVQAVLDSQFWLFIHVLLVVGSYGVFILAALLGHFFIGMAGFNKQLDSLTKIILQALYIGTIMLISGTILGGVWAAQSWGRFWDWDPKESWAFISCCLYVAIIHAYRFHKINALGLAAGAIFGALAISFTWYGVNYLIGTGLHSYGFGNGGAFSYLLFIGFEGLFLIVAFLKLQKKENLSF